MLGLLSTPAWAAPMLCASDSSVKTIMERYAEVIKAKGLSSGGGLVLITASKKGTFTVIIVYPNKVACYIATGTDFVLLTPDTGL